MSIAADVIVRDAAPTQRANASTCPICNAQIGGGSVDWTDYACGARVSPSAHGSWSLTLPCGAEQAGAAKA